MKYKHLFGPVPSRRLGLSLGIDLVPHKTCNLNCVYCECGNTTHLTNIRKEYVSVSEIISELKDFLGKNTRVDFLTFSGAGEPLLNSGIGEIISFLKEFFPFYKLALLTNGILLGNEAVCKEVKDIDLIIPSLDAGLEKTFKKINRPCKEVIFKEYINGLKNFSDSFSNEFWLEIFLLKGMNDTEYDLEKIKNISDVIKPDKIQLNTVDRPTAEKGVVGVSFEELVKIKEFFGANTEIIGKFNTKTEYNKDNIYLLLNCLERRPLTVEDLREATSLHINELNKILSSLEAEGKLKRIQGDRGVFYKLLK